MDPDPTRRTKQMAKIAVGFAIIGAASLAVWYFQNKQKSAQYHTEHTNVLSDDMVAQNKKENEESEKDEIKSATNNNDSAHHYQQMQEEKSIAIPEANALKETNVVNDTNAANETNAANDANGAHETNVADETNPNTDKPENVLLDSTEDKQQENLNQSAVKPESSDADRNKKESPTTGEEKTNESIGTHDMAADDTDTANIKKIKVVSNANLEDDENVDVDNENENKKEENVIGNDIKQEEQFENEHDAEEEDDEFDESDLLMNKILNRGGENDNDNPEGTPSYSYSTKVVMDSSAAQVFGNRWSGDGYEFNENNDNAVIDKETSD